MKMKGILGVLVLCFMFVMLMSGCGTEKYSACSLTSLDTGSKNSTNTDTLPAVEVTEDNKITPEGGALISKAQELIIDYLVQNGTKGDIRSHMQLDEITVREAWENAGIQIYRVDVDYAWLHGVAVIKDEKVLCVLDGMPTYGVFLADLDNDRHYEIYTNVYFGSGIVSSEIRGYNIASDIKYSLSMRMQKDLLLFIRDKSLWVKEYPYRASMEADSESVSIGRLALKDNTGKKDLCVEAGKSEGTEYTGGNIFSPLPELLTVDLVGSNRQQLIADKQTIQKIIGILNSIDLKPMSDDDENGLMLSSLGGLRIVPDKDDNRSVYVHGAGAIYIPEPLQRQLDFNKKVCYMSEDTVRELYSIINAYVRNEVLTQTVKAVEQEYPTTANIGQPIICDLVNSYDGKQTLALVKRETKDGEPPFNLYILDEKYNILAEFSGEVPKTLPYTAYTIYYGNQTITFGGLGDSKWNPDTDEVTSVDITNIRIEYDKNSGYSITPMTKYGYIFVMGSRGVPAAMSFYNDRGELQADQNDFGVGLGMVYDSVTGEYRSIED